MRKVIIILLVLFSVVLLGCHNYDMGTKFRDFAFVLPDGFSMSDATETECSIVNDEGVAVGGLVLTKMSANDLTDADSVAMPIYLNNVAEGCEYFSWDGGDSKHPIQYVSQIFEDSTTQSAKTYYHIFFVKDFSVYDMWFDTELITKDSISAFLAIAEVNEVGPYFNRKG